MTSEDAGTGICKEWVHLTSEDSGTTGRYFICNVWVHTGIYYAPTAWTFSVPGTRYGKYTTYW